MDSKANNENFKLSSHWTQKKIIYVHAFIVGLPCQRCFPKWTPIIYLMALYDNLLYFIIISYNISDTYSHTVICIFVVLQFVVYIKQ